MVAVIVDGAHGNSRGRYRTSGIDLERPKKCGRMIMSLLQQILFADDGRIEISSSLL
jgi:hypothetical protein